MKLLVPFDRPRLLRPAAISQPDVSVLERLVGLFGGLAGEISVLFYTCFFGKIPSMGDVHSRPWRSALVALETEEVDAAPFWQLLRNCSVENETVVVVVSRSNLACFEAQYIRLYATLVEGHFPTIAFLPLGHIPPEATLLLSELAALTGGQVFPEFLTEADNGAALEAVKEFFGDPMASELRRGLAKRRSSVHGFEHAVGEHGAILSLVADLGPVAQQTVAELDLLGRWALALLAAPADLAAPSRRWARGLRVVREAALGLRDVTFFEPGDLGLELANKPWRVLATFPPASSLGLQRDTEIAAIHGVPVTASTSTGTVLRALARRPVILTFRLPESPSASACPASAPVWRLQWRLAVDLASEVLERRAQSPWTSLPTAVGPSLEQQTPPVEDCSGLDVERAVGWGALTVGFDATAQVVDVRKLHALCFVEDAELWTRLREATDAVTPALFAVAPGCARKLRNEGVAVEVLFVAWLLQAVFAGILATGEKQLWRLLVVFVLRLARLDKIDLEATTREILQFEAAPTAAELTEAAKYPLDRDWAQSWWRQSQS